MTIGNLRLYDVEQDLRRTLPSHLHNTIAPFLYLLQQTDASAKNGQLSIDARPDVQPLLQEMAGQEMVAGGSLISFGAGSQLGNVTVGDVAGGHIVKLSIVIHMIEQVYDVRGMDNPYLGLRSFTYNERDRFAGRARLVSAAQNWLVGIPGNEQPLLFVSGASGSGKSSYAQAGIIPMLEQHYQERHLTVRRAVFTPRTYPLASLRDGLQQLGLPAYELNLQQLEQNPADLFTFIQQHTPPYQRNLIVLDQFEELFNLTTAASQRDALVVILTSLPQFEYIYTHIIITMRADYRDELETYKDLYDLYYQQGQRIDVKAMEEHELQDAMYRPIQSIHPNTGKALEPALYQRLAREAAGDGTYLPLLQVTLEELWRGGSLTLSAYGDTTLATAIQRRADIVLQYHDFDDARAKERSSEQQQLLLDIFTDLIKVPIDSDELDIKRVVRRRLPFNEVSKGSQERHFLIDELSRARLLAKATQRTDEAEYVEVTIIHDALIREWNTLRIRIALLADELRRVECFRVALQEWLNSEKSKPFLLSGGRLLEAEDLLRNDATVLHNPQAQEFLEASVKKRKRDQATQVIVSLVVILLLGGIGFAGWIAWEQQQLATQEAVERARQQEIAEQRAIVAKSQRLAEAAKGLSNHAENTELTLILALEALLRDGSPITEQALRDGLQRMRWIPPVIAVGGLGGGVQDAQFSSDGRTIIIDGYDGKTHLWDLQGNALAVFEKYTSSDLHFSPDGTTLLTVSDDGTLHLRDRTGNELHLFEEKSRINHGVYSPDGQTILTATRDGTLRLWDLQGNTRAVLTDQMSMVDDVTFSPDGKTIMVITRDGTVRLWNQQGNELAILSENTGKIKDAAFSSDEQKIVTISENNTVRLWDIQGTEVDTFIFTMPNANFVEFSSNKKTITVRNHNKSINLLDLQGKRIADFSQPGEFSPDGQTILGNWSHDTVDLWNLRGERLAQLPRFFGTSFSPDGKTIVTVPRSNAVPLYNSKGRQVAVLEGHMNQVLKARFSPDGQYILTVSGPFEGGRVVGSADYTARLWSSYGGELAVLASPAGRYLNVEASLDGQMLVTSGGGKPQLWDWQGNQLATLADDTHGVDHLALFRPDGQAIMTRSMDGTIRLWDIQGNELSLRLDSPRQAHDPFPGLMQNVAFSTDGEQIIVSRYHEIAQLWHIDRTIEPVPSKQSNTGYFYSTFSPDGQILVTSELNTVRLWDLQGNELATLAGNPVPVDIVVFSPDGQTILTASTEDFHSEDYTSRLWDLQGTELAQFVGHRERVTQATFSPDGQRILTASMDGTARIWNLQGDVVAELIGHSRWLTYAAFSPDGQTVVTTSSDETARVWDLQGNELTVLVGHTDIVRKAVFSTDGSRIVTASDDGTARIWLVNREDLLAIAACRVSRDLTNEEMERFAISERWFVFSDWQCPPTFSWE